MGGTGQEGQSRASGCLVHPVSEAFVYEVYWVGCPAAVSLSFFPSRPLSLFSSLSPPPTLFLSLCPAGLRWDWGGLHQRTLRDFLELSTIRLFTRRKQSGGEVCTFHPHSLF